MAKHKMPAAHGNEVNVTPLIDIIMCLIIFFMLVAKIGVTTGAKPMTLPESYLGKKIEDMSNTLTLNILPSETEADLVAIEADQATPRKEPQVTALVDGLDRDLPINIGEGASASHPLRETLVKYKKQFGEDFKVIIRAHAKLPFKMVEPVLIECANANAPNVNFTTKKNGEGAPAE